MERKGDQDHHIIAKRQRECAVTEIVTSLVASEMSILFLVSLSLTGTLYSAIDIWICQGY